MNATASVVTGEYVKTEQVSEFHRPALEEPGLGFSGFSGRGAGGSASKNDAAVRELGFLDRKIINVITSSGTRKFIEGPRRTAREMAGDIRDNAAFIDDLVRLGAASPSDLAHIARIIALDAEELKENCAAD